MHHYVRYDTQCALGTSIALVGASHRYVLFLVLYYIAEAMAFTLSVLLFSSSGNPHQCQPRSTLDEGIVEVVLVRGDLHEYAFQGEDERPPMPVRSKDTPGSG